MAASSKAAKVDTQEKQELAGKVELQGWKAQAELALSFVSDVQLSAGSVETKVLDKATGDLVYLCKGMVEKPDMQADIFGFGSGKGGCCGVKERKSLAL